jgi:tRNA(Ile)-lysidine synthase
MFDPVLKTVKDFLTRHHIQRKPLLVGFSGGPDSLALFHILLECRPFFDLDLHIAHVDHGWRPESSQQAAQMKEEIEKLKLPFYLRRLENIPIKEEAAREARLAFFQELYHKLDCQAVVLGHQGDDQSETVLKRILEGASLMALKGMASVSHFEGMQLWRPLLDLDKKALQQWLDSRGLKAIEDPTNLDPRYLRARMRTQIVPGLKDHFGKEVCDNLRRLGALAEELSDYLTRQLEKYEALIVEDHEEKRVDFSEHYPLEPVEIKAFLKKMSEKNKIFLSHESLQTLYEILEKGTLHRKVGASGRWVEIRGRCIAIKKI